MKQEPKYYEHDYDKDNKIDMLAMELERQLTQVINDRTVIDSRMVEDLKNYHGKLDDETIEALKKAKRSHPFIKLTRAKTNAGESQLVDLLFPNDDKNYGIKPTPRPELAAQFDDKTPVEIDGEQYQDEEGNQITQGDLAERELEIAKERCENMELTIDDQLIETKYNSCSRKTIHDACVVGTGILKGPVVMGKLNKAYTEQNGEFVLELKEAFTPGVEVVRPWDFFPDLSASEISEAEFVFERRYMSRQQIAELPQRKGFKADQVKRVLKMTSQQTQHTTSYQDDVRKLAGLSDTINDSRYETWEYHGPIDNDVLIDVGAIDLPEDEEQALAFIEEMSGEETMATVFYCGGIVMGARVHLMSYEGYMPYRVFNWEPDDSSIFGYGIPRMVRDEQGILNTTWRMMLDNGGITAGPQIGVNKKYIQPADGDWEITPFKQWNMIGSGVDDIRKAFTTVEFNSHLNELQGVYQVARVLFDEVSGVPMLQQGEQGQSTQTLGGMSMLMNAANTVRRRQVKDWDDNITEPMISDFYHWNMIHHNDNSIKGDYQVDARGTSALLVKETQAQALTNFMSVAGSNPVFAPVLQLKAVDILREWVKTQGLPSSIIPTDDELEQYQKQQAEQSEGQPQDPAMAVEQLRMQQLQAKQQFDSQMFDKKAQLDSQEQQANIQIKYQQLAAEMQSQQSKERIETMKLAQNEKINSEKLITELKKQQANNEQDWAKFSAEIKIKQLAGQTANYGLE